MNTALLASGERRFLALLALLIWAPIPLGSNRPWAWGLLEFGVFTLLALFFLRHGLSRPIAAARWPLRLLVAWLVWLGIYLLPLPVAVLQVLSPATVEVYRYSLGQDLPGWLPLSLDPGASLVAWLKSLAYVGLFYLLLMQLHGRRRRRQLALVLVGLGALEALLGLVDFFTANAYTFVPKPSWKVDLSGSYVNRNHFAGFLEMAIPITSGLWLAGLQGAGRPAGWRSRLRDLTRFLLGPGLLWLGLLVVLLAALILSGSRGAVFALAAGFAVGFVLLARGNGAGSRELRLLPWMIVLVIGVLSWMGSGQLGEKLAEVGLESNRDLIRQVSYHMAADYPLTGTGPGSYRSVFPLYKDRALGASFYDHAHNDYLEVLVEQGVIGFILLCAAVAMALAGMARGLPRHMDRFHRGLLFGSLVGCLALSLHALVDFNWQIPANAAWFFALLALGIRSAEAGVQGG